MEETEMKSRIEKLERELAEQVNKKVGYYNDWMAEKALADRFASAMFKGNAELQDALSAYRKARGL